MPQPQARAKGRAAVTFVYAALWILVALTVSRMLSVFMPPSSAPRIREFLSAVFLLIGLHRIASRTVPDARPMSSVGFVRRPSSGSEFTAGLAIGWGIALLLLLPALFTLRMRSVLLLDEYHAGEFLRSVVLLLLNAVVTQLVFTGLAFRSLARATSPALAATAIALISGALLLLTGSGDAGQALFVALGSLLFSIAALRTRAIWLPLGLQVGWGIALTMLFGVGSFYWPPANGLVQSYLDEPRWLTGGSLGPEASIWAIPVLLAATVVLWRCTRDWAWHYTFEPIEGAGYPMDVAPPVEHTRMEAQAAAAPQLVQIQGGFPQGTTPKDEPGLRG